MGVFIFRNLNFQVKNGKINIDLQIKIKENYGWS